MASFPTDTASSSTLNQSASHDTNLYDPNVHDNRIVAMYETQERANAARDRLVSEGVPAGRVEVMDQSQDRYAGGVDYESDGGLWGAIKGLFVPVQDAHGYAEGVRRGHSMLVVNPEGMQDREHIIQVLETTDPIDFDARLEEWRQAGYTYPGEQAGGTVRDQGASLATGASAYSHSPHVGGAETGAAMGAAAGMAAGMTTTAPVTTHPASATTTTAGTTETGMAPAAGTAARSGADDTLRVVEERLRVGKREVARGAVRVRSYVVERPVEEQVHLHEERVTLERRPVDRPAVPGDIETGARTLEAVGRAEEAVVAKEARVVEEIGIRKEASDRVETVRDSVRKTEVEVDDTTATTARTPGTTRVAAATVTGGTGMGTTGTGTGVGASVDRTLNTNVSGANPGAEAPDGTGSNPPGTMASRAVDKTLGTNISGANPTKK